LVAMERNYLNWVASTLDSILGWSLGEIFQLFLSGPFNTCLRQVATRFSLKHSYNSPSNPNPNPSAIHYYSRDHSPAVDDDAGDGTRPYRSAHVLDQPRVSPNPRQRNAIPINLIYDYIINGDSSYSSTEWWFPPVLL